jgi:hypothetical protein
MSILGPAGTHTISVATTKRATTAKTMKSKKAISVPLAKGQLWKMEDKHIEIMEVGKTLTHYRLFQSQKRVPISLGGIAAVQAYLTTNGAKLIRKAAPLKV